MKKSLVISIVLIFFGLVFVAGSIISSLFYPDPFALLVVIGFCLLVAGIYTMVVLVKKKIRMSGTDLAKEVILEQLRYLSQRINKKQIKKIKFQKNEDKLDKEIECLQKASDKLMEVLN